VTKRDSYWKVVERVGNGGFCRGGRVVWVERSCVSFDSVDDKLGKHMSGRGRINAEY